MKHFSSRSFVLAAIAAVALPVAPALALEGDETGVRLSLEEALKVALENNLFLVLARQDPRIAEQRLIVQDAAFDGAVAVSGYYQDLSRDTVQVNTTLVRVDTFRYTTDTEPLGASASYANRFRFGGEYDLTLSTSQLDPSAQRGQIGPGIFSVSDFEMEDWRAELSYSMPLLRGFGKEYNTYNLLLAKSDVTLSRYELQSQAETTIKAVEDAYWNLVAARAAVEVAQESLRLAQDLLDLNRKKVEVGTLAPIEVTQAEAGVASREEEIIRAETSLQNAEDVLHQLMAIPAEDPRWDLAVLPTTETPGFERRTVDADSVLEIALANRAEVLSAKQNLSDSELTERVAKNGTRHGLNFGAVVGFGADTYTSLGFTETSGGISEFNRFDEDNNDVDWRVGLTYSYPIRNRAAKATHAAAALSRERSESLLYSVELSIRTDVRIAARNVESGAKRVDAARSNTVLQRKTLEAEQKKFENGMSTSFEVLRIQTDLSNARFAEIRAILDYTKALADLERAQGTLLAARGLRLEDAAEFE